MTLDADQRIAQLEAQVAALRGDAARLADLVDRLSAAPPAPEAPQEPAEQVVDETGTVTSRRRLLGAVAAAVAAGGVAAAVTSSTPVAAAGPLTTGSILNTATSATALTVLTSGPAGYGLGVSDNGFGTMPPAVSGGGALFGHAKGNAVDSGVLGIAIGDSALAGVRGYADRTATHAVFQRGKNFSE